MAEYDSLPRSPDAAQRFVRPNADGSTPTPAQAVESAIDNPILKANPTTLGEKREVVTTDTRNTTTTTDKSPEVIDPTSIHTVINPDKSVTVSFSPRAGWSYEYRLDSGTWNTVSGASFTTGILTLGTHTLSLREKNPRNNAVGTPTSVSLNITNPNTAPTAIGFSPASLTAGSLSVGQNVGTLTCTDAESTTCTYTLSSQSASGAFAVVSNGAVTVANAGLTDGTYTITVVATDGGGLTRTETKNITVNAAADTVAPSLTSSATLSASNIGTTVSHTLTFDEAINTVSVGTVPSSMTVTATKSGNSVTLDIATTASFTAFGSVTIPLTVTDNASPANSRTVNINKTINDVAPVAGGAFAALTDMTVSDQLGAAPIIINAG